MPGTSRRYEERDTFYDEIDQLFPRRGRTPRREPSPPPTRNDRNVYSDEVEYWQRQSNSERIYSPHARFLRDDKEQEKRDKARVPSFMRGKMPEQGPLTLEKRHPLSIGPHPSAGGKGYERYVGPPRLHPDLLLTGFGQGTLLSFQVEQS